MGVNMEARAEYNEKFYLILFVSKMISNLSGRLLSCPDELLACQDDFFILSGQDKTHSKQNKIPWPFVKGIHR